MRGELQMNFECFLFLLCLPSCVNRDTLKQSQYIHKMMLDVSAIEVLCGLRQCRIVLCFVKINTSLEAV